MNFYQNSGVYRILNVKNNKCLVGSCDNFGKRKSRHFKNLEKNIHNTIIQYEYNKYGKENFIFEVLEYINKEEFKTIDDYDSYMIERENYWMDKYNSYNPKKFLNNGYNLQRAHRPNKKARINLSNASKNPSKETREKISKANKGNKNSLGKKLSNKTKNKLSEKSKGKNNGMYGKKHSDEKRKQMSNTRRNNFMNEEKFFKIISLLNEKIKFDIISKETNVSCSVISQIKKGTHWSCEKYNYKIIKNKS